MQLASHRVSDPALQRRTAHAKSDSWSAPLPASSLRPQLLNALARAILAGDEPFFSPSATNADAICARCAKTLSRSWPWLKPLARRLNAAFATAIRPKHRHVVHFLRNDRGLRRACAKYGKKILVAHWFAEPQFMQPIGVFAKYELPQIASLAELSVWLGIETSELEWFADIKGMAARSIVEQLQHYKKTLITKRSGSLRLIEAPKLRLKQIQRRVLRHILATIPAHSAVHGFVRGRSALTFAAAHEQMHTVLRMDVKNFFPTIRAARIGALFRTFGYPESVAETLAGLCTTMTPHLPPNVGTWEARKLYARRHLPQGAPTSPALANLCMYRADCRLSALARVANATYTRYADDLAFSGGAGFGCHAERFSHHVAAILLEEGFAVQHRKTRIMSRAARQHLAGLVVNVRANVSRDTYDLLKAILTNCVRLGPESQNRELHPDFRAHLDGRVSYVAMTHPVRGERLRQLFERIVWTE